jgi:hypothetical protein
MGYSESKQEFGFPVTVWLNCHKPVLPSVSSAPAFPKGGFYPAIDKV